MKVGRDRGETLALAEVGAIGVGDAHEGVHAAGVAAEYLVDGNTSYGIQVHEGVIGIDGVHAEVLCLTDGRVKHHTSALMIMNDLDMLFQEYLVENGMKQVHGGMQASSSRRRDKSSPLSYFPKEDNTHAAHYRKHEFRNSLLHIV